MTRKNYLFAGSDSGGARAAAMYTLTETAKMNGLNPEGYLRMCSAASPITRSIASTGSVARLLRARQLRLWALGEFVADTMSYAIGRSYGANIEVHWYMRDARKVPITSPAACRE
jgi:hypothetical protein